MLMPKCRCYVVLLSCKSRVVSRAVILTKFALHCPAVNLVLSMIHEVPGARASSDLNWMYNFMPSRDSSTGKYYRRRRNGIANQYFRISARLKCVGNVYVSAVSIR